MLFLVPDGAPMSGACYMVDDKRKTILKIPLNQFKNAPLSGNTPILASLMEKNRENITETGIVLRSDDLWTADIKIGPQPEWMFKLPEGYQVMEFSAMLQHAEGTVGSMLDGKAENHAINAIGQQQKWLLARENDSRQCNSKSGF